MNDDWRHSAKCRDADPADFDDAGTPSGWEACRLCIVRPECLADCFRAKPVGVYRAMRYWPEMGGSKAEQRIRAAEKKAERTRTWMAVLAR